MFFMMKKQDLIKNPLKEPWTNPRTTSEARRTLWQTSFFQESKDLSSSKINLKASDTLWQIHQTNWTTSKNTLDRCEPPQEPLVKSPEMSQRLYLFKNLFSSDLIEINLRLIKPE